MLTQKEFEEIKNMSSYEDYLIDLIYKLDHEANRSDKYYLTLQLEKSFYYLKSIYVNKSWDELLLYISQKSNKEKIIGNWVIPQFLQFFNCILKDNHGTLC